MLLPSGAMSHRKHGYYRDNEIAWRVGSHRCLNAEQVQVLLFPLTASGKRKCQQRLKRLTDQLRLRRFRYSLEEPYAYFRKEIKQIEHTVLLNWAVIWIERQLKSWEEIYSVEFNYDMKILITDCFIAVKNTITGSFRFMFIEMDIHHPENEFDKVRKYNKLYDNLPDQWWIKHTKRFPAVLLVTNDERKFKEINKLIKLENKNGLEFKSYLVGDLRREVLG